MDSWQEYNLSTFLYVILFSFCFFFFFVFFFEPQLFYIKHNIHQRLDTTPDKYCERKVQFTNTPVRELALCGVNIPQNAYDAKIWYSSIA